MRHYFFVAENNHGEILGFAQMSYSLDINFCFLDLLANNPAKRTGGLVKLFTTGQETRLNF
jgi:hypothetical protein